MLGRGTPGLRGPCVAVCDWAWILWPGAFEGSAAGYWGGWGAADGRYGVKPGSIPGVCPAVSSGRPTGPSGGETPGLGERGG